MAAHHDDPPAALVRVARQVSAAWMTRVVESALAAGGVDPAAHDRDVEAMVAAAVPVLLDELEQFVDADVDEQRTTPLSLYRRAVDRDSAPTTLLRSLGVDEPPPEPGAPASADPYRLGPAAWSDIDPAMHEVGIAWGAWKAMTVLRRRRDEGRR